MNNSKAIFLNRTASKCKAHSIQEEKTMPRVLSTCFVLTVLTSCCFVGSDTNTKVYGKNPTINKATAIKSIIADPEQYADKEVLVSGKVASVCKGRGCWVEVMDPDGDAIICRSLDESVTVPMDCEGRSIQVQGQVKFDKIASGKSELKKHEGMAEHACPAPKVLVSMEGALFPRESPSVKKTTSSK